MAQTREPSDSENNCPEHMCISRVWKRGIEGATLYFSKEMPEYDVCDIEVKEKSTIDDELEFDEMMEESSGSEED